MKITITVMLLMFCFFSCNSQALSGEFNIYPESIVVKTGHTVRFTAVAEESSTKNFTPDNCLWKATGGSIDVNGAYHAYKIPGTYEVSVSASGKVAKALVTVVPERAVSLVKPGAIFIRRWHFYSTKADNKVNMRVSALIKGETVRTARLFLINADGSEVMLGETPIHHNGRAKFHAVFTPAKGQWIDFKSYDHLDRIMAHTRRMI